MCYLGTEIIMFTLNKINMSNISLDANVQSREDAW